MEHRAGCVRPVCLSHLQSDDAQTLLIVVGEGCHDPIVGGPRRVYGRLRAKGVDTLSLWVWSTEQCLRCQSQVSSTRDACICGQAGALDRDAAVSQEPWQPRPTVFAYLNEKFLNLEAQKVVVMQRRLGVRRQPCGNCRERSSSQDMSIVTSAVRVDVALTFAKKVLPPCFH